MSFLDNTAHMHLYCICGMEITGVVDSVKNLFGVVIFGLRIDGSLCHHVVTGRIISNISSKDDIIIIEPCELSIVSRYGTEATVAYFDNNN